MQVEGKCVACIYVNAAILRESYDFFSGMPYETFSSCTLVNVSQNFRVS